MRTKEELRDKLVRDLKNQIHHEKTKRMKIRGAVFYALGIIGLAIATYNYQILLPASRYAFWIFIILGWLPIVYDYQIKVTQDEIDERFNRFFLLSKSVEYLGVAVDTDVELYKLKAAVNKAEAEKGTTQTDNIFLTLTVAKLLKESLLHEQTNDLTLIDEIKKDLKS
jgi:hypothetical protein